MKIFNNNTLFFNNNILFFSKIIIDNKVIYIFKHIFFIFDNYYNLNIGNESLPCYNKNNPEFPTPKYQKH